MIISVCGELFGQSSLAFYEFGNNTGYTYLKLIGNNGMVFNIQRNWMTDIYKL